MEKRRYEIRIKRNDSYDRFKHHIMVSFLFYLDCDLMSHGTPPLSIRLDQLTFYYQLFLNHYIVLVTI